MNLIIGPLLRYVGEHEATIWVETDEPCEVEVLGRRERTFHVEGHHYALVIVEDLEPGSTTEYEVALDGKVRWPDPKLDFPPSVIRTLHPDAPLKLSFGSCRVSVPHDAPYNLGTNDDERGREVDALYALALRMREGPVATWPAMLMLLGDQVYADEVSPRAKDFIESRRDVSEPPGEQVANFEEYTRLYWESWEDPVFRWLVSTVSTSMIFDDHDVHDDWNTSQAWLEEARATSWWDERIVSALMSYWIYQHIGNLSPRELRENELFTQVKAADDAGPLLRRFAFDADRRSGAMRWSYCRDLGGTRLIVMDSRAGRVLDDDRRCMMNDSEWDWIVERATGDFDHLLLATSLPALLAPGMQYVEAWSEAICDGRWGKAAARAGEKIRQAVDLEHWGAFGESFEKLALLLEEVASGKRGRPPASIVLLSGDVHHAYLAEVAFRREAGAQSAVYQAVCSPVRNPLGTPERAFMRAAASKPTAIVGRALAHAAGVRDPSIRWRFTGDQTFDNQIATLDVDGREASMQIEKTTVGSSELEQSLQRQLA